MHVFLPGHREKGGVVPKSFLGVLKMNTTNESKPLLPKHCGRFTLEGMQEFECFTKTLLSKVQQKKTRHKQLRGQESISKCFTVSNKAFALLNVLDNKLHVWDPQIKQRKGLRCKKNDLRMEKKCMQQHGSSGKCCWSKEGHESARG